MRCSWCGHYGHNRRGCPSRPEESKKRDPPKRPKTCSWCGDTKHTRPKCGALKSAKETWILENSAYRKRFLEDVKKYGFNYGVLMKTTENSDSIFYVKEVIWDYVRHDNIWAYNVVAAYVKNLEKTTAFNFPSWYGMIEGEEKERRKRLKGNFVICSSNEFAIENYIPADWLSGVSGVEDAFNKSR